MTESPTRTDQPVGMSDKLPVSDIDLREHIAGVLLELHYEGDPGMLVNARDDADVLLRETERWLAYVPQRIVCGNAGAQENQLSTKVQRVTEVPQKG